MAPTSGAILYGGRAPHRPRELVEQLGRRLQLLAHADDVDLRQVAGSGRIMKLHVFPGSAGLCCIGSATEQIAVRSGIDQETRRNAVALGGVH